MVDILKQIRYNNYSVGKANVTRCGAVGSALVLGEVASAHGVRLSEHNEAQRSKLLGAPSRKKFWAPQEGYQNVLSILKQLNIEVWRSW